MKMRVGEVERGGREESVGISLVKIGGGFVEI